MALERFSENPLISPADVIPSRQDWEVLGAYNCGAFTYENRIGLLVRVIERPVQSDPDLVSAPLLDFASGEPEMTVKTWRREEVDLSDPRFVVADTIYDAVTNHLRLAWSDDGRSFAVAQRPTLTAERPWESFGIQDPRVLFIDGRYVIIFSAGDHRWGVTQTIATTDDWQTFERLGVICMPDNKDVALFPERVNGKYCAFHRPSGVYFGGHNMWLGYSEDLVHWGEFVPLALTRPGTWDCARIGCGAEPLKTDSGWLQIYHGSDGESYYLGAMLLDLADPSRVLARSEEPLLAPREEYERVGYYDNVVFCNGVIRRSDDVAWLYYGGADRYTCGCEMSIPDVLDTLT